VTLLLNMADLARDAVVAPNTAKSWLSILQGSGPGGIICLCQTNLPLTNRFHSIPVAAL
jgi:hypothetical protein